MTIDFQKKYTVLIFEEINPAVLIGFAKHIAEMYPYDIQPESVHYSLTTEFSKIVCKCTIKGIYNEKMLNSMFKKYINLYS